MTESLLHRCTSCHRYTLTESCPAGHGPAGTPHPARYSPQDRYARYRRALAATSGAMAGSEE
ncbi:MAG: nucleolar RNA-binding Nop10p family protein [Thermoplasmata archaeon]